jgi:hypothetical protein
MTTHPNPHSVTGKIPCDVCHKEIPLSEARRFEAEDYVANFCGLDCYAEWKQRSEAMRQPDEKPPR